MKIQVGILLLLLITGKSGAQGWPFQKYPAAVLRERPVVPRLSTPIGREHASIIRTAVRRGPNFAGHYTIAVWGCATACGVYVIVDDRTGKVYAPPEISKGVDLGFSEPAFRIDSSLIVIASCPDPWEYRIKGCERKFYRWDGTQLVLLKAEAVTEADAPKRDYHAH